MALQQRLANLENELAKDTSLIYGHTQREPDQSRDLKGEESGSKGHFGENQHYMYLAAPRSLVKKDLSVITGDPQSHLSDLPRLKHDLEEVTAGSLNPKP